MRESIVRESIVKVDAVKPRDTLFAELKFGVVYQGVVSGYADSGTLFLRAGKALVSLDNPGSWFFTADERTLTNCIPVDLEIRVVPHVSD
jgi:hypothetical protein